MALEDKVKGAKYISLDKNKPLPLYLQRPMKKEIDIPDRVLKKAMLYSGVLTAVTGAALFYAICFPQTTDEVIKYASDILKWIF